jgi:hypothetical protein
MDPSGLPAIDTDNDGSGGPQEEIAALTYITEQMPDDVKVTPGHGKVASKIEVTKFLDVLKGTAAAVQARIDQGKTLEQLRQEKVLAKWEYINSHVMKIDAYLGRLHLCLTRKDPGANDRAK